MRPHWLLTSIFLASFVLTFGYLVTQGHATTIENPFVSPAAKEAKLLFVGDMMFDRTIRTNLDKNGADSIFGKIAPLFREVDFVAGNLEGPITSDASLSSGTLPGDDHNTSFTFDPRIAGLLASYGVKLVSIGNNHILDFGRAGVASTTSYLDNAGIRWIGDPFSTSTESVLEEINGIKIAFVAYDQFIKPNPESARVQINRARALGADFVVVMTHWGNEYDSTPPNSVRTLASSFASTSADLIIGTHPHVIGEIEDIGHTRVYYSLGNFIFDQYWDESVRCGLTVSVTLTKVGGTTASSYETKNIHLEKTGATTLGCN